MQTLEQLQSGQLIGVKNLKLSCALTTLPNEILDLCDTLEFLDLSGNQLKQLPDDFKRLQRLKIAFFSNNDFTEYPAILSECSCLEMVAFRGNKITSIPDSALCSNLRWLILTNNRLTAIPSTIGKCVRLQKLMLAGNALTYLPESLVRCKNLELIRLSANQFTDMPSWLFSLPKLSWLGYAGNPCSALRKLDLQLPEISWSHLKIIESLGEGASGIIHKAQWLDDMHSEVAVKLFRGEITSDGSLGDELYTCMAAGAHPNLVKLYGRISGHPEKKKGLVLEFVPSTFKNLGGPPSFQTCTRDIYPKNTIFTLDKVIQIASQMVSVATHLHHRGIMHGDLYAHNILIDDTTTLLGDFGAATFYRREDSTCAFAVERLEVRAFGCLLEELLEYLDPNETNTSTIVDLDQLKTECLHPNVLQRPDFRTIYERIVKFQQSK